MNMDDSCDFMVCSSNGWEKIWFRIVTWDTDVWALRITMTGQVWDRLAHTDDAELIDDVSTTLNQVIVPSNKIRDLEKSLADWRSDPSLEVSVILAETLGQHFSIRIAPIPELISSPEKPVLCVHYKTSKRELIWRMVVDQSCLHLFREGIVSSIDVRS